MRVSLCIPHYFKPSDDKDGYGSTRQTARITRTLSLGRCLGSLISLQRLNRNCVFNMASQAIEHYAINNSTDPLSPLEIEITVCTDGENTLGEVLDEFRHFIQIKTFELEEPKNLPIATRDWLLRTRDNGEHFDLYVYLEDDIVINDLEFFNKQLWFLSHTKGRFCLMPHRYEPVFRRKVGRLLIDGPLKPSLVRRFSEPRPNAGRGIYRGIHPIEFDIPENPHSGLFVISNPQKEYLSSKKLATDGFISPLETAATLTVLEHFTVFKPSVDCTNFLTIEHGHPSFTSFMNKWEHRPLRGTADALMADNPGSDG